MALARICTRCNANPVYQPQIPTMDWCEPCLWQYLNDPMIPTTQAAQWVAALFNRRLTTPWTEKEVRAYKKLYRDGHFINPDDLELIWRYYVYQRRKTDGIHRRDLLTFLNNFAGELDRARAWDEDEREKKKRKFHRPLTVFTDGTDAEKPATEADFKRVGAEAHRLVEELRRKIQPSVDPSV